MNRRTFVKAAAIAPLAIAVASTLLAAAPPVAKDRPEWIVTGDSSLMMWPPVHPNCRCAIVLDRSTSP